MGTAGGPTPGSFRASPLGRCQGQHWRGWERERGLRNVELHGGHLLSSSVRSAEGWEPGVPAAHAQGCWTEH